MEDKNKTRRSGILLALLAAALYAVSSPLSKILLAYVPSTLMAGLLYIGAGIGMLPVALIRRVRGTAHGKTGLLTRPEARLTRRELPYTVAMILLACVCWGFENNCTRKISSKDPLQIVLLKGIFSGAGSVVIGLFVGERITALWSVFAVLGVGLVAYGLSIFFYVYAQRLIGAARCSAYYAVAPFISTLLSLVIFREKPPTTYFVALALMVLGAWLSSQDKPLFARGK